MRQSDAFLRGEGAAWLQRNLGRYDDSTDPVLGAIQKYKLKASKVLEVGCADGARLHVMERMWGSDTRGVDPGARMVGPTRIVRGTADDLSVINDVGVDIVIYGWCLYLCDPSDYFGIASEGDRVLKDGGHIVVYDFCTETPYKVPYKHKEGLFSHHHDFSKLWLGHPAYSVVGRTVQDETCVTILRKNLKNAFPVEHD